MSIKSPSELHLLHFPHHWTRRRSQKLRDISLWWSWNTNRIHPTRSINLGFLQWQNKSLSPFWYLAVAEAQMVCHPQPPCSSFPSGCSDWHVSQPFWSKWWCSSTILLSKRWLGSYSVESLPSCFCFLTFFSERTTYFVTHSWGVVSASALSGTTNVPLSHRFWYKLR